MSLAAELAGLLEPRAYPHPCTAVELVETHISWVLLTGDFAYKVKKPVHFPFVDFSTLERRAHFCREELRCNRRFAPALYLDVVAIGRDAGGALAVGDAHEPVEWAVQMRQFPTRAQLDRLLAEDALTVAMLSDFGRTLAAQHQSLPVQRSAGDALDRRVLAPARDNYHDVADLPWAADHRAMLESSRAEMERQAERHRALLVERLESGWLRECHGDLHLSNLVLLDGAVTAFDCLEFNADLRWIDPMSDVAFLFMDCLVRQRPDLGYGFLDGYLEGSGDYAGATLLPWYAAYRSMVRAKVAGLRHRQAEGQERNALEQRSCRHLQWAERWLRRPPGLLVLMCGLSGSGKSHLAGRLAPRLPALRLRSDVTRKVLAGLDPRDSARDDVGVGLYAENAGRRVYDRLAELAADLLRSGEHVIVDAAFLEAERRERFRTMAAGLGTDAVVVHCDAPIALLEARIRSRESRGTDPSDAGLAVLDQQTRSFIAPQAAHSVRVDTGESIDDDAIEALTRRLLGQRPGGG